MCYIWKEAIDNDGTMINLYKNLFVGGTPDIYDIRKFRIQSVLNIAMELNDIAYEFVEWYKIGLSNTWAANNKQQIEIAYTVGSKLFTSGVKTLIHCHDGLGRSVFISFLVLRRETHLLNSEILNLINNKLPGHKLYDLMQVHEFVYTKEEWYKLKEKDYVIRGI